MLVSNFTLENNSYVWLGFTSFGPILKLGDYFGIE